MHWELCHVLSPQIFPAICETEHVMWCEAVRAPVLQKCCYFSASVVIDGPLWVHNTCNISSITSRDPCQTTVIEVWTQSHTCMHIACSLCTTFDHKSHCTTSLNQTVLRDPCPKVLELFIVQPVATSNILSKSILVLNPADSGILLDIYLTSLSDILPDSRSDILYIRIISPPSWHLILHLYLTLLHANILPVIKSDETSDIWPDMPVGISSEILSGMSSDIFPYIRSDMPSDILSEIPSDTETFWHLVKHLFWHYFWRLVWH